MTFTESNTVEQMILDAVSKRSDSETVVLHQDTPGWGDSLGGEFKPTRWDYLPAAHVPRQSSDVMVESWVREALIRLNPEIAAQPDRADEVIYNLRACILSVQADGLVRANENFMAWLRGEKTMPFGPNGEHVSVRLVDSTQPANNRLTVCNQWTYQIGAVEKRFDVVFLVNGLPIVIGEAKTPTRSAVTWFDGAFQVNEIYEKQVPAMFVPNVFSFATEGRLFRYGSVRMPIDMWGPWRDEENQAEGELHHVKATVESMLRPEVVLDILQNFTLFATDKKHRRIKIICRYQQYFTTNQIVDRVVKGYPKKGLIWHFQGSGKSLLMVFAAQKLRMHPKLGNPTVIIVVDRIDLDTQITATFNAADVPNMVGVATRQELQTLLGQDVRKVLITTIHKFGESGSTGVSPVSLFSPYQEVQISERNLPHWKQDGKTYFVTFRLADSLPAEKLRQLKMEREEWTRKHESKPALELSPLEKEQYYRLFHQRVEEWLDQGAGACVLADLENGRIVADALQHFEGKRYFLGEWIVMPNHVHVVITTKADEDLSKILHSWKSFTAKEINRRLGRKGNLWQEESYSHLVRNGQELYRINEYIAANPGKAGVGAIHGSRSDKFGDSKDSKYRRDACATAINERSNIIVMVDEAHRTQEGDLGRKMREALPNAFLFGLTGTPINRADRNTFWAFGADEDEKGYMSRYSFQESIRDKATLPLHFEAPEVKLKIDKAAIDEAYKQITGNLSEQDRDDLAKRAAKMAVLVKNPERVRAVVKHIVKHFQTKVEPNGFKAQVVTFDRECCVLYKAVMDELIGPEASAIVMTSCARATRPNGSSTSATRMPRKSCSTVSATRLDPLKFVIVTSKLLTGFDAPILQVMYLDKPMKDHNLLQAICRTNRTFGQEKTHGLIVDYIGIFDDVAQALDFDEKAVQQVVSNIDELRKALPVQMQKCLAFFPGVDRTVGGYEGLMAAQQRLPNNEVRDKFAAEYSVLGNIWEALSPDPCSGLMRKTTAG